MDICFAGHRYAPMIGGYENQLKLLAEGLSQSFNVKVITYNLTGSSFTESLNGIEIYRAKPRLTFFRVPLSTSYLRLFDKIEFDVLHSHGFIPVVSDLSIIKAKLKKKTAVYTHHFDGTVQDSPSLNLLADFYGKTVGRFCVRFSDAIVATSESYAASSSLLEPFLRKVHVIPCLVDCNAFFPQPAPRVGSMKKYLGIAGKKTILFVGRIVPYKGLEYLVRAFERVRMELSEDFHLLIVGGEEGKKITDKSQYYQSILRLAKETDAERYVHFLGRVKTSELPLYYSLADVVVLPSIMRGEAFGSAVLESLACGTPVVASRIDGVKDVLSDGNTVGSYVPPKDDYALSEALVRMAYQKNNVIERCRQFAFENYRVEKIVKKYVDLYQSLS